LPIEGPRHGVGVSPIRRYLAGLRRGQHFKDQRARGQGCYGKRLVPMMLDMPGWQSRKWLFGSGPNGASNFRRDVRSACELAGVDYYAPHEFGRHAFASIGQGEGQGHGHGLHE
jgi:hypothetical protein